MEQIAVLMRQWVFAKTVLSSVNPYPAFKPMVSSPDEFDQLLQPKTFQFGAVMHHGMGFHRYQDQFFQADRAYNFSLGLQGTYNSGGSIAIKAEALLDFNNSKWDEGKFYRRSLTFPVHLQLNIFNDERDRLFAEMGGYYRYSFYAKANRLKLDMNDDIRRSEWGLGYGIGVQIFPVQIGWISRRALTGLTRNSDLPNTKDANNLFYIGVLF